MLTSSLPRCRPALDGWPAVAPWLFRRSSELVITRTWCTNTARKTTRATTTSWPLRTRRAATAIRIPEHPCSSLTLSAPDNVESDATAGSTVCFSIRSSTTMAPRRRRSLSLEIALRICRSWTTGRYFSGRFGFLVPNARENTAGLSTFQLFRRLVQASRPRRGGRRRAAARSAVGVAGVWQRWPD